MSYHKLPLNSQFQKWLVSWHCLQIQNPIGHTKLVVWFFGFWLCSSGYRSWTNHSASWRSIVFCTNMKSSSLHVVCCGFKYVSWDNCGLNVPLRRCFLSCFGWGIVSWHFFLFSFCSHYLLMSSPYYLMILGPLGKPTSHFKNTDFSHRRIFFVKKCVF